MEFQPGTVFLEQRVFSQSDLNRFAKLSWDDNPIHVDPEFAARSRFGRPVAHGMLIFGVICSAISKYFQNVILLEQEMIFLSPTYVGELIDIKIEVINHFAYDGISKISTVAIRPNGELGCQGKATIAHLSNYPGDYKFDYNLTQTSDIEDQLLGWLKTGLNASINRMFTSSDVIEYMNLTGDRGDFYHDTEIQSGISIPGGRVPNCLLGCIISYLLGTKLPGRGTNWLKQSFQFPTPALQNQNITTMIQITKIRPEKQLVNLESTSIDPDGSIVCIGRSLVLVRDLAIGISAS